MRIAVAQLDQHSQDVPGNLTRIDDAARRAAHDGAALLVLPEMILTGYALGRDGSRRLAEASDGGSAGAVAESARRHGVGIVYGYPELAGEAVHNSIQAFDAEGTSVARYRKTHLFGPVEKKAFTPGTTPSPVVDLGGLRVGFLICYDVEFPEAVRQLALDGAELVVVPTANMVGYDAVPLTVVPARAYENGVFVAYANCSGAEKTLRYGGLSVVAAPDGTVLARADRDESWLLADLDPAHPGRTLNTYLADRRPDLY